MPRNPEIARAVSTGAPALLERILVASAGFRAVVLIDGRSGSGKSMIARELHELWPAAQLVRLDDVYPGWGGLDAASTQVAERMLAATNPRWQRWDWERNEPAGWVELDANRPLIVEGVGALSRANRRLASFGIWLELDTASRKARAMARDGETYAPHWDDWAAQEETFIAREQPRSIADLIIEEDEGEHSDLVPRSRP